MKKCFFIFFLALVFKGSAQDFSDSLSRYSYLIQTKESGNQSQATGFFVRYKHRLFFITAAHCLTGWDPFQFKQIDNFPDTVFIRLSNDTSQLKYLPLLVSGIKKTSKPFHEYESPDVYVVEIKEPAKYTVFSIEHYFEDVQCDFARTIMVFGYPHGEIHNDYLRDRQQPFTSTATLNQQYCVFTFRPEAKLHDPLNYYTYIKDGTTGPGLSGAPAYLLTGNNTIAFGGIYIGGADQSLRTGMVVRPEYVFEKINSKILNK